MPEFANPFCGLVPDRKVTMRELTRSLRMMLAAEQEAVFLYEALADATDHPLAKAVLQDVADEERVHAGEFQRVLSILVADEDKLLAEGAAEVDEEAAEIAGSAPKPEAETEGNGDGSNPPLTVGDMKG